MQIGDFLLIGVVIVAAMRRAIVILFGLLPLLTYARISPLVERPYGVAICGAGCAAR